MTGRPKHTAGCAMRSVLGALCLVAFILSPTTARAQDDATPPPALDDLPRAGHGGVARVLSGHELELFDGRRMRLAGLLAPLPDPGAPETDGFARAARDALSALTNGAKLEIRLAAADPDRYGRLRAHLLRAGDGLWLQAALLRAGHAQVFTTPETAAAAAALYAHEAAARRGRQGLWSSARYRPMPADAVTQLPGRFTIVRGRVREATKVGGTLYLNFGEDWRSDFTLRLPWEARRRFPEPLREAAWWTGRLLEMRGMLESYNGPMITARHPAEIRMISDATAAAADGGPPGY